MKVAVKDKRGQSTVEFLMILPIVLLLVFGILSFGFLIYDKMIAVLAVSQAAERAGELYSEDSLSLDGMESGTRRVARSILSNCISTSNNDIDIIYDGCNVTVRVQFKYTLILPFINDYIDGDIPVKYQVTYRVQH